MDIHSRTDRENKIGYSLFIYQLKFQAYVEDDNDIFIEDDIVKAVSFNGGIYGNTAVPVDAENISGKKASKKI